MSSWKDAAVSQKIENACPNLGELLESVKTWFSPPGSFRIRHNLEENPPIRSALGDVSIHQNNQVKMDIAIKNVLSFLVLAKRVIDHQSTDQPMSLSNSNRNLSLGIQ